MVVKLDMKDDHSVVYSKLLKSVALIKPTGSLALIETLNFRQQELESFKVDGRNASPQESLVRLLSTDTDGQLVLVVTSHKTGVGFMAYLADLTKLRAKESISEKQTWSCSQKLLLPNIRDASVTVSPTRIYLTTENLDREPEILIMTPCDGDNPGLLLHRSIHLPDFGCIASSLVIPWASLLLVGCSKHLVVFVEDSTPKERACGKFVVSKIYTNVFEGSWR